MKIFIAGPRAISKLSNEVIAKLDNIIKNNYIILVGDANGVDKAIQKHYSEKKYTNVIVYASNGKVRNNIGGWNIVKVDVPSNIKGFDFYTAKDLKMAKDSDYGFMIWNGKSKGSFNNVLNLVSFNKTAIIYFTPNKNFYKVENFDDITKLVALSNNPEITDFFNKSNLKKKQLSFTEGEQLKLSSL